MRLCWLYCLIAVLAWSSGACPCVAVGNEAASLERSRNDFRRLVLGESTPAVETGTAETSFVHRYADGLIDQQDATDRSGIAGSGSQPLPDPIVPEVEAASLDPIDRYGEAPIDRTPQFLRQVTPLLRPGQWQVDYGLVYALQEFDLPVLVGGTTLVRGDLRRRNFITPFAVRYGYDERTQLFANLPVGWSDTEFANPLTDQSESRAGLGDLTFGLTRLLDQNRRTGRSTIGTLRVTAPTGDAVNPLVLTSTGLGNGVWRLGGDLLCVQSIDPVILFYGAGYTYTFEEDFGGVDVHLGHEFLYNFGLGFAANEKVTLSTALLGSFISETRFDDRYVANTDREPVRLRMAATIAQPCKLVEPFVSFGLTDTAPSFELGVVWTR